VQDEIPFVDVELPAPRHCFVGDTSFTPSGFVDALEKFNGDTSKAEEHMKFLA